MVVPPILFCLMVVLEKQTRKTTVTVNNHKRLALDGIERITTQCLKKFIVIKLIVLFDFHLTKTWISR